MNMAASRRLILGSNFFRISSNRAATPSPTSVTNLYRSYSPPQTLIFSPQFIKTPRFPRPHLFGNRYCSSSAVSVEELTTDSGGTEHALGSHPWPEWVSFVDGLKSKGYFDDPSFAAGVTEDGGDDAGAGAGAAGAATVTKDDLSRLKHACLNFARERFDLCKSLSREDIETVVKYGCPSLNRKAVNSAKRLRAYVRLDEGDVCSSCTLRGSCDRAYVMLKDSEAAARTVDVVRMLLLYALDPLVHSGEKPHGRENIEASARKLLTELIELSETAVDPALPKPAVKVAVKKSETVRSSQNIEMKRGDWTCSNCNFMNFARNVRCLECKADGPKRVSTDDVEMKKGDWNCPQCQFMNFARNKSCLRCQESRPQRQLNPGEWECPKCDFLNYRKNTECLKCNCDRPRDDTLQYEEQAWRSPR